LHRSYAVVAALLVFSFGFSSAFADEGFVNPNNLAFDQVSNAFISQPVPTAIDPLTGQTTSISENGKYVQVDGQIYDITGQIDPQSVQIQQVTIGEQSIGIKVDTLDRTANILAVLLLTIPFGLIVYRMSDSDPIPLKYAKLSGVAVFFVAVFFAMASMLTLPITTGNSYWGYASASPESPDGIPQPIDSLYFDTLADNLTIKGALTTTNDENSAISLDGQNDYLVLDSALSEKLDAFTVSAWVKPDYKKNCK
jgi:hypothetical protein